MKLGYVTIFPPIIEQFLRQSLIGKALDGGELESTVWQLRDFADPPHFHVDDTPYGGGAGMVIRPEPALRALRAAREKIPGAKVIFPSPSGQPFNQKVARQLAKESGLIFLCGRYEGIDHRIYQEIDQEISLGDYVLMGGEVAALAITEAVVRLCPGVIGNLSSTVEESFSDPENQLLEAPHYTRPAKFEAQEVPAVLLSGNHAAIASWRKTEGLAMTKKKRPDLLHKGTK